MQEICSTIFSITGAAFGSFLGVILFFFIRLKIEKKRKQPMLIATYLIANEINKGQGNEQKGQIMHHHGKLINVNDLSKYNFKNLVWEYTNEEVGIGYGSSIFYGPYSTDLYEPGNYEIIFYIKGIGFSKPKEIIDDCNILEIDVNEIYEKVQPIPLIYQIPESGLNPIIQKKLQLDSIVATKKYFEMNIIGKKYIKVSDLSENYKFSVFVYSTGKGIWEYRAFAFDGKEDRNNNIENYKSTKIFFDKIEIFKLQKLNIPWN